MKTKLIQTQDYLLLIDEEAEIKIDDLIFVNNSVLNTIDVDKSNDYIFLRDYDSNGELNGQGDMSLADCTKVIAYYPLNSEAKELDGLPLLPNPFEKVDVNVQTRNFNKQVKNPFLVEEKEYQVWEKAYIEGFDDGIAQSKQFSLEDMEKAYAQGVYDNYDSCYVDTNNPCGAEVVDINQEEFDKLTEKYFQSLSTQQTYPKEFVPEYKEVTCGCDSIPHNVIRAITNAEGRKELVGTYKY